MIEMLPASKLNAASSPPSGFNVRLTGDFPTSSSASNLSFCLSFFSRAILLDFIFLNFILSRITLLGFMLPPFMFPRLILKRDARHLSRSRTGDESLRRIRQDRNIFRMNADVDRRPHRQPRRIDDRNRIVGTVANNHGRAIRRNSRQAWIPPT